MCISVYDSKKDLIFCLQNFGPCSSSIPTIGTSSEMMNQAQLEFNSLGQAVEMVVNNPMDVMLRRTISAPVSIPHAFLDSSSLNVSVNLFTRFPPECDSFTSFYLTNSKKIQQIQHLTWEDEMQNLYCSME